MAIPRPFVALGLAVLDPQVKHLEYQGEESDPEGPAFHRIPPLDATAFGGTAGAWRGVARRQLLLTIVSNC